MSKKSKTNKHAQSCLTRSELLCYQNQARAFQEQHRPTLLMNGDTKVINKILANTINSTSKRDTKHYYVMEKCGPLIRDAILLLNYIGTIALCILNN